LIPRPGIPSYSAACAEGHDISCPYKFVIFHAGALSGLRNLLTALPTKNVMAEPIKKYHVNATAVYFQTQRIVAKPTNMPASAPVEVALRLNVPRRKRPRRLPKGRETTVSPASRSGPHFTKPKAMRTRPQTKVMRRARRRN